MQKALHDIQSYSGGKLPVLVGFADAPIDSLENYKRGYYQYQVQTRTVDSTSTLVRVTAKITAWYEDSSAASRVIAYSNPVVGWRAIYWTPWKIGSIRNLPALPPR